jgi:glycosyltransferase involved in cell wall biosynthesis
MTTEDAGAPALSVVIAVRDAAATLPAQLDALLAQDAGAPWELVVADNGSTDGSRAVVAAYAARDARVRLVDAGAVPGPAHARNAGAAAARGRALAFCDADDVVGPRWVGAMAASLRDHEFVTGPLELEALNPDWLAGARGSTGTAAAAVFEESFPFASSCNLGIRAARFAALHGFDEHRTVGEDIELSLRLHRLGVPLEFVPDAIVHYRLRPTLGATYRQARSYGAVRPELLEELRRAGEPTPTRWRTTRNWAWLLRHAGLLRDRAGRARWLWVAGQRVGNLQGSVRVRRLYP